MKELRTRFGLIVRQLRDARGWSQEDLAATAELNRSYLGEIERAAVMPSLGTAAKLARALEIPLSQLIAQCEVTGGPINAQHLGDPHTPVHDSL